MRSYLIGAIAVTILAAVAFPRPADTLISPAPRALTLLKSGNPAQTDGYTVLLGTVPEGKVWTIKHVLPVSEKHTGPLPVGGEFTVDLFIDGSPVAESSTATGNRVNYQGQGSLDVKLPPGAKIQAFVWLRPNGASWDGDDNLSHYYWGLSVLVQEDDLLQLRDG